MEVFDSPSHYYPSDAMSLEELAYWIAFNRVSGIGPVSFKSLLDYYHNDLEAAWRADSKELAQAGLTQKTIENMIKLFEMIFDMFANARRNFNVPTRVLKPHDLGSLLNLYD